jgi:CheY-like chemotaxis protein/DNA-directed RNA polymerase specialized sigma24 family protein
MFRLNKIYLTKAYFLMTKSRLSKQITKELPYLRRYARALVGNQTQGDDLAIHTLEAILSQAEQDFDTGSFKVSLFKKFHQIWLKTPRSETVPHDAELGKAMQHLSQLAPNSREVLLLHTIEKFSRSDIAAIMEIDAGAVGQLLQTAHDDMKRNLTGQVLIIEDEQLIAKDISALVEGLGHSITGIARTYDDAIALTKDIVPDLILSDIQLATEPSGIEAVRSLHDRHGDIPVIYITAFPEMLLTGEGQEPTFLITKPFKEDQVQSAISQAMFFR